MIGDPRNDYEGWNLWLMRNCADCAVEPCRMYMRERAAVDWGKPFKGVPDCDLKVKI